MAEHQYVPRPVVPMNLGTLTATELNALYTQTQLFIEECRYYCNLARDEEEDGYYRMARREQDQAEWEHRRVARYIGL